MSQSLTKVYNSKKDKTIRVQGDLITRRYETIEERVRRIVGDKVLNVQNQFDVRFKKTTYAKHRKEINKRIKVITDDVKTADEIDHIDSCDRTKEQIRTLRDIKKKYGLHTRSNFRFNLQWEQDKVFRDIVERQKQAQDYNRLLGDHIDAFGDKFHQETWDELKEQMRQTNLRLGNHLIVIEKGIPDERMWFGGEITVPETTKCFIIHDEHQNIILDLPAGVYGFGLLQRHASDRR